MPDTQEHQVDIIAWGGRRCAGGAGALPLVKTAELRDDSFSFRGPCPKRRFDCQNSCVRQRYVEGTTREVYGNRHDSFCESPVYSSQSPSPPPVSRHGAGRLPSRERLDTTTVRPYPIIEHEFVKCLWGFVHWVQRRAGHWRWGKGPPHPEIAARSLAMTKRGEGLWEFVYTVPIFTRGEERVHTALVATVVCTPRAPSPGERGGGSGEGQPLSSPFEKGGSRGITAAAAPPPPASQPFHLRPSAPGRRIPGGWSPSPRRKTGSADSAGPHAGRAGTPRAGG